MIYASAVRRGCGVRIVGGIYAELGLSEDGVPLEAYIVDPPIPVSMEALGMTPIAIKLIEKNGVWHVFDYCGEQYYPNVADFLEEVRRFGMSRRLQKGLDFSKLTSESRIVMIHRKAWIEQREAYKDWRVIPGLTWHGCPNDLPTHPGGTAEQMCCAYWWQDIDPDEGEIRCEAVNPRDIIRVMPSFEYLAVLTPQRKDFVVKGTCSGKTEFDPLIWGPGYSPAIFASFPIGRLAVVRDPEGGKHEEAAEAASEGALPVDMVDE